MMLVEAVGTDAIAAGVADVPRPVGGELISTALTGYEHGVSGF